MALLITWGFIVFALIISTILLFIKERNYITAATFVIIASIVAIVDVVLKCQASEVSEACVWGKAWLHATVPLYIFASTPIYIIVTLLQRRLKSMKCKTPLHKSAHAAHITRLWRRR